MKPHYLKPLAPPYADYDRPGRLLASADAGSGTVIVLDDHRVRTYYGPDVEEYIDAAGAAVHWLREDLGAGAGETGITAPVAILEELDKAINLLACHHYPAHELNSVLLRLIAAVTDAHTFLGALAAMLSPSPTMKAATDALRKAGKLPPDARADVKREMRRVLRRLTIALAPFGEVTRG